MKGSVKIATLFGIDVFIHWTFLILVVWLGGTFASRGSTLAEVAVSFVTITGLFGCVVLHELGHALVARRFGIGTSDITLLPIGGVARLERMPREPMQEFWVAVAGPAVNVVIAVCLAAAMFLIGQANLASADPLGGTSILANLFTINVVLVLFNMLPAFPMDGGRVLRALLAMRMTYLRATRYAARLGQVMAFTFALLGLMGNPLLLFIALFVYVGASGETRMAEINELIGELKVRSGMMTRFVVLDASSTLGDAMRELIRGQQQDFPVVREGRFIGMLRRSDMADAIENRGDDAAVETAVSSGISASENDSLEELMLRMQQAGESCVPVIEDGAVVGLVSNENIRELMMIRAARSRREVVNKIDGQRGSLFTASTDRDGGKVRAG